MLGKLGDAVQIPDRSVSQAELAFEQHGGRAPVALLQRVERLGEIGFGWLAHITGSAPYAGRVNTDWQEGRIASNPCFSPGPCDGRNHADGAVSRPIRPGGTARVRAKSCIQLFMWGGPPQQETFDLKPHAPEGIGSMFKPIATSVPGTQICEHLPKLARMADRFALLRSVTHPGVNHGTSAYHMLTGHLHPNAGPGQKAGPNDMPSVGCAVARFGRAPARFDDQELAQLNARIVHQLDYSAVAGRLPEGMSEAAWLAVRPNLNSLADAAQWWDAIEGRFETPAIEPDDRAYLAQAADLAETMTWGDDPWHALTAELKAATERKGRALFLPLRRALTGADHGPDMAALLPLIGQSRAAERLRRAAAG